MVASRHRPHVVAALAAVLLVAGCLHAWSLRWVCDDAFVSFRYARNLIEGLGLVYNAGERVEGYSNFLWTLLVAGGMALGCEPAVLAQALGVACFAGTLALAAFAARGRVPIAALAFAALLYARVFATGGLETSLFTLLVLAVLVRVVTAEGGRQFLAAGVLAGTAALTRPDGALLGASAALVAWSASRRGAVLVLAGFTMLLAPFLAWRLAYYGELLPNTFYAKSAHDPYVAAGWVYLREYALCHYVLLPALPLAAWLLWRWRARGFAAGWAGARAPLAILAFVVPYVAFVVWVGGDFMFARLLVPVTAPALLAFDLLRDELPAPGTAPARGRAVLAVAVPACAWFCLTPAGFRDGGQRHAGLSDEHRYYTAAAVEYARDYGRALRELTRGLDVRVLIGGASAMIAYEARFPVVIEGCTGLTDHTIARRALTARGPVGHEKEVDPLDDYVVGRGVHLALITGRAGDATDALRWFEFRGHRWFLVRYDAALLRELARRAPAEVRYPSCEAQLDEYLRDAAQRPRDELERDYRGFCRFYFDHNHDPARQQRFAALVGP